VIAVAGFNLLVGIIGGSSGSLPLPDEITMVPATVACFLLMGSVLVVMPGERLTGWRRSVAIPGAILVACTCVVQLEVWVAAQRWIDGLPSIADVPSWMLLAGPRLMSPFAAIGFVTASLTSLIWLARARGSRIVSNAVVCGGLVLLAGGCVFGLANLYAALPLYQGSRILMARGTGLCFALLGLGLIVAASAESGVLKLVVGRSVRARLLRSFLPYAVLVVVGSDSLALIAARLSSPASSAVTSAASVALATGLAIVICTVLATYLGRRLERAESELRLANELLETRVEERTNDLEDAKRELELKNDQLQRNADELAGTARAVRCAHRELQDAHEELKRAETQLIQAEKQASLGQLVAGVAHEFNNPLAYVSNNLAILERDLIQLVDLIRLYRRNDDLLAEHKRERLDSIQALAEQIDLDYVLDNLPSMIGRSRAGLKRIQQIVGGLRDFARLDEADLKEADLNQGIGLTLEILQSLADERGITLIRDLRPLPLLTCYPAKINQVVLNLVSNAIDASSRGATVSVSSGPIEGGGVEVVVVDFGHGIAPSIRSKIFDPFFTTKPVGRGTGLGLSISLGIVQAHGGTIRVESEVGQGSRFTVRLPGSTPVARDEARFALREIPAALTATVPAAENVDSPYVSSRPRLQTEGSPGP
jgi:signal transduction histidine kinase